MFEPKFELTGRRILLVDSSIEVNTHKLLSQERFECVMNDNFETRLEHKEFKVGVDMDCLIYFKSTFTINKVDGTEIALIECVYVLDATINAQNQNSLNYAVHASAPSVFEEKVKEFIAFAIKHVGCPAFDYPKLDFKASFKERFNL